jgi:hypothetical protein
MMMNGKQKIDQVFSFRELEISGKGGGAIFTEWEEEES